jgi:hypothetical protein
MSAVMEQFVEHKKRFTGTEVHNHEFRVDVPKAKFKNLDLDDIVKEGTVLLIR